MLPLTTTLLGLPLEREVLTPGSQMLYDAYSAKMGFRAGTGVLTEILFSPKYSVGLGASENTPLPSLQLERQYLLLGTFFAFCFFVLLFENWGYIPALLVE